MKSQDWKPVGLLGWFGNGKVYEVEKGHYFWVGDFSGTFLSDKGENSLFERAGVKCPGWYDFDVNSQKFTAGGYCAFSDLDGDQAYAKWQSAGSIGVGVRNPGTSEWTGGTDKYKEIEGSNTFVVSIVTNWPDGSISGYSIFNR
jgi:hypothetical protein